MILRADEPRQNPTDSSLSPQQEMALTALLAGQSVTAAAKAAGVARCTVHAWLKDNFDFQAALNRGQRELRAAARAALLAIGDKAVAVLKHALNDGDARIALELVKGLGLLDRPSIGPDDPAVLRRERERIVRMEAWNLTEQDRTFPIGEYHDYSPI